TPPAMASTPLPENVTQNRHQPTHERSRAAPAPNRHAEHRPTTNPPARRVTPPRYSVDSGLGGQQWAQPHVGVMFGGLADRPLDLPQRPLRALGRLGQRRPQRPDQEPVGVLFERERRPLARAAY